MRDFDEESDDDMVMEQTAFDLSKYRPRIIREAVDTFRTASYFRGKGGQSAEIITSVCEGMLDLLEEGPSRDPVTVRVYMQWLYNLIRKESKKVDTTLDFLDTLETIVTRQLNNQEDADVDVFFEMCREQVQARHAQLVR